MRLYTNRVELYSVLIEAIGEASLSEQLDTEGKIIRVAYELSVALDNMGYELKEQK